MNDSSAVLSVAVRTRANAHCTEFNRLDRITCMAEPPQRVTPLLLDVLQYLLDTPDGAHGYAIVRHLSERSDTREYRRGTVYPVLDRILGAGWATGHWDTARIPARRVIKLSPDGVGNARTLVNAHRPDALGHQPTWDVG